MSYARCFKFLDGVPELIIPDNLKSTVTKPYPDLNPIYQQLATHYNTVIVPARPYKSKDKTKAEIGVQMVEHYIIARLRNKVW